jgi:hypothetical protein
VSPLTTVAAVLALTTALATVVVLACLYHGRDRSITAAQDALDEDEPPAPTPYRRRSEHIPAGSGCWLVHEAQVLAWLTEQVRTDSDPASDGLWDAAVEHAWLTPEPTRKDLAR